MDKDKGINNKYKKNIKIKRNNIENSYDYNPHHPINSKIIIKL